MSSPYVPCITRMLIDSHNAPMTHCHGEDLILKRCCVHCNHFDPLEGFEDEPQDSDCSLKVGLDVMEAQGMECPGDNDILDLCERCDYYKKTEEEVNHE